MRTPVGSRLRASASRRTCLRRLEECRSASTPAWIVSNYQLGSSQVAADPSSNQSALVQTITDSFASPYLPICESWYDAGPEDLIAVIYYDHLFATLDGNRREVCARFLRRYGHIKSDDRESRWR
jgi:hypothetical protein